MQLNYTPAIINLYKEFPVIQKEIKVSFSRVEDEENDQPYYIYKRVVIKNSYDKPIGEATIVTEDEQENDYITIEKDCSFDCSIILSEKTLQHAKENEEYSFVIQIEDKPHFAWANLLLENLNTFENWTNSLDENQLIVNICNALPTMTKEINFFVKPLLEDETLPLCLDFGTSFSSCALNISPLIARKLAFKDNNNSEGDTLYFTKFLNHKEDGNEVLSKIVPSVMVLKKIEEDKVEWLFGYDAQQSAKSNPEKGTYIIGIKNFLSNLNEKKYCKDFYGRGREFTHEEIVTAYLEYLTTESRKYFGINFKTIHVTIPVFYANSQKYAFEKILSNLGFNQVSSKLDEARAPLYHFLAPKVELAYRGEEDSSSRLKNDDDTVERTIGYLIIDCGGGSTDATLLRNININIDDSYRPGFPISMSSDDPVCGGNTEFGGIYLTTLLFNYIKLRFCAVLYPEKFAKNHTDFLIDSLITMRNEDIFYNLYSIEKEKNTKTINIVPEQEEKVYGVFNAKTEEIEDLFPTNVENYKDRSKDDRKKVIDNYNILWQYAESLKIALFANDAPKEIDIFSMRKEEVSSFWFYENNVLVDKGATIKEEAFTFKSYEVSKLFSPKIFIETSRIIRQLNIQEHLADDSNCILFVRFVGQSTSIPAFNEAIAYFVPKRIIEEENRNYKTKGTSRFQEIDADEKKICCVSGAAKFMKHTSEGKLRDTKFISSTKVLKNFCRMDENGEIISNNTYLLGEKDSNGILIKRGSTISEANGVFLRGANDIIKEYFGTSYDEQKRIEGYIGIKKSEISRLVSKKDADLLETLYPQAIRELTSNQELIMIQVQILEDGSSQSYEFKPYLWNAHKKQYMTTEKPIALMYI